MDEIEMFERLRPADDELRVEDREDIRREIFASPTTAERAAPGAGAVLAVATRGREPGSNRGRWAVAAAVAALAIAAGSWLGHDRSSEVATADQAPQDGARQAAETTEALTPTSAPGRVTGSESTSGPDTGSEDDEAAAPAPSGYPPLVLIDVPGWTLMSGSDTQEDPGIVLVDPASGFDGDGPIISVQRGMPGVSASYGNDRSVTVGAAAGTLSGGDSSTLLLIWPLGDREMWATGYLVDESTMVEVAAAVSIADGELTVSSPVAGLEVTDGAGAAFVGRSVDREFRSSDGTELSTRFYGGGGLVHAIRTDGDERETVSVHGVEAKLRDYGVGGRYRMNFVIGPWAWEIDGEPFASRDEFVEFVDGLRMVDPVTWSRSLPAGIVGPDDWPTEVAAVLRDIPVPEGFDPAAASPPTATLDRYQLGAKLTGAVTCAWLDVWADALAADEPERARQAIDALATAPDWTILVELDAQGGWSDALWDITKRAVDHADDPDGFDFGSTVGTIGCSPG